MRQYFKVNPVVVRRRQHYSIVKMLDFMWMELGLGLIDDLLRCDVRQLTLAIQA
ncbi:MAG: hypothetical protein L2C94_002295 [Aigarchaeota archaeon]|nr:hypothetical protein [Candidatus Wolframiiraptor gerlachensis]